VVRPLLLIRNEREDDFGLAPGAFREEHVEPVSVDAWDESRPWPSLEDVSALVVFGGTMNCDQVDAYPFLARERSLLAEAVRGDLPVLGVCLGAQLLVRAFDCPVFPAPVRELGFPEILLTDAGRLDPVLGALPPRVRFFQWHEDAFRQPPGATVLATGGDGGVQAFRSGSAWGVQFHPEVTAAELSRWFSNASATLQPIWGRERSDLERETAEYLPSANDHGRHLFRQFARYVRERAEPSPTTIA
jgi:GMP synthase (glutamine-hydrolysing)